MMHVVMIAMLISCVPAQTTRTYAPDVQWCREVEQRQWTLSAATQGLGALSGGLGLIAATQEADTALWLSLSGAVLAAAGVTTAHLGQSHATAYAEQCGPRPEVHP